VPEYLLAGGKVTENAAPAPVVLTLQELVRRYVEAHSNGALEENSLTTVRLHLKHIWRCSGNARPYAR